MDFKESLSNEFNILSEIKKGLDHPNIIFIHDLYYFEEKLPGRPKSYNYLIVMELAKCSLQDMIRKKVVINLTVKEMIEMIK